MTTLNRFYLAVKAAGIPTVGVSIGSESDRSTWRIDYADTATAQNRTDGDALVQTFDPTSAAAVDAERTALAAQIDSDLLTQALGTVVWRELQKCTPTAGQSMLTAAQFKAAIKAAYQNLLQ